MKKQWSIWAVAGATAMVLTACGGGDGGSASTATQDEAPAGQEPAAGTPDTGTLLAQPFLGTWLDASGCSNNWTLVPASYGSKGGSFKREKIEISDTKLAMTSLIYSDQNCTQVSGNIVENYALAWSPAAIAGWSPVARIQASFTGYTVSPGLVLDPAEEEPQGNISRTIVGIKRDSTRESLYLGDNKSVQDADGYPTAFKPYPDGGRFR